MKHSELDRAFITPGTELSFDLYVGDFWINFHDRVSITEDAYQDPTVSGTGDYARLENAVGVASLWDLNKVVLRAGYDHVNYVNLTHNGGQTEGQSELFSTSAGYAIQPETKVGVDLGAGLIHYRSASTNQFGDATQWSAGGFYEREVSQYLRFRGGAGYTVYQPDSGASLPNGGQFSGVYGQVGLTHRITQYVDYTLSGGRNISFTFYGGTVDLYYVYLQANWKVLQKTTISTPLTYEHGKQATAFGETFDRYGTGISFGRNLARKLNGSLGYQFYWRDSDVAGQSYTVNVVSLSLSYAF